MGELRNRFFLNQAVKVHRAGMGTPVELVGLTGVIREIKTTHPNNLRLNYVVVFDQPFSGLSGLPSLESFPFFEEELIEQEPEEDWLFQMVRDRGPFAVFQDDELFYEWLIQEVTLKNFLSSVSNAYLDAHDSFTNDYHAAVSDRAARLGLEIDEVGSVIYVEDEWEEDDDE